MFSVVQETVQSSGTRAQMNSMFVQIPSPWVCPLIRPLPSMSALSFLHLLCLLDPNKQTLFDPPPNFLMDQTGSTGVSIVTAL